MDKYQKFILDRIKYASNFVFCHCTPTSNTLDGSMEQYGVFDRESDTFRITQDEDIHKTKYLLTIDTKSDGFNPFEKVFVCRNDTWKEIPREDGYYRIPADFEDRIEAVRFAFVNHLVDDYILKITYTEADREKYDAKMKQEKEAALLATASIKVSTGADLVNIYFQPCCEEYDHTEINLFVPKESTTISGRSGSEKAPSDWSMIKKCAVPAEDFFKSVNGLAYGKYAFVLKQYDKDNHLLLETDYIVFSIIKPAIPGYGTVNVI